MHITSHHYTVLPFLKRVLIKKKKHLSVLVLFRGKKNRVSFCKHGNQFHFLKINFYCVAVLVAFFAFFFSKGIFIPVVEMINSVAYELNYFALYIMEGFLATGGFAVEGLNDFNQFYGLVITVYVEANIRQC